MPKGEIKEALDLYLEAVKNNPNCPTFQYGLGEAYMHAGVVGSLCNIDLIFKKKTNFFNARRGFGQGAGMF